MNVQEAAIDKLNDIPHVTEADVFTDLMLANKDTCFQFSPYVLAGMWNESDAVKFGFAKGRTAADFMQ